VLRAIAVFVAIQLAEHPVKNESSVRNQSQVERAQRLRRQIERLKAGRIPEERPEHGKSLKEQIEERLGKQTKSAEEHEA
jgi:Tfp pilus assembly protein PilZ